MTVNMHGNAARTPIRGEPFETDHTKKRRFRHDSATYQTIKTLAILICLYGSKMVLSLVSVKCLALIFLEKMIIQYT
jgi:hypothetical protein